MHDPLRDWEYALEDQQPDITEPDRDQEATEYFGRVLVRVPKSIHKALVEEAAHEVHHAQSVVPC